MNVVLLGGPKSHYLEKQVSLIEKYVEDLEGRFICFLNDQRGEVPDGYSPIYYQDRRSEPFAYFELIRQALDSVRGPLLFLHGDCFPIRKVSVDVMKNSTFAGPFSFRLQWFMATEIPGWPFFDIRADEVVSYPMYSIPRSDWSVLFPDLDYLTIQICRPCFVHLDDYSIDSDENIEKKLEVLERIENG